MLRNHRLNHSVGNFPKRRAFTLVELLVVIAIMAILAAMLFPAFARSREMARRASCQTNIRFLSLAIRQYAQDNDETLPLVAVNNSGVSASVPYGWADAIQPYIKSVPQLQCPSDSSLLAIDSNGNGTTFDEIGSVDYFYNSRLSGMAEAKVISSSAIIMLGDYASGTARNAYDGGSGTGVLVAGPQGSPDVRHPDGANYAFADGHVKWLQPSSIFGGGATPSGSNFTYGVG